MSLLALLVLVSQVDGGAATPAAQGTPAGVLLPLCSGVKVGVPGEKVPSKGLTFSSRAVLELEFRARLRLDLRGEHLMHLKVFTPGGFLYQDIALPFVGAARAPDAGEQSDPTRGGTAARATDPLPPRLVEGFPEPLAVQRLVPVRGDPTDRTQYELVARLPVAGTSITLSSLYGRWRVQPYLDAQPGPCGPATDFTITE